MISTPFSLEILGSGGAVITPRPGCACRICEDAISKGPPYARTGPSVFLHGPNILIDTPEESAMQLARARIQQVSACLFTHWHPDHTRGIRVLEMNMDWRRFTPKACTAVHLFPGTRETFEEHGGLWGALQYSSQKKFVSIIEHNSLKDVSIGCCSVTPLALPFFGGYGFLFSRENKRILVCLDEVKGWSPPPEVLNVDLAILPLGIVAVHPPTGAITVSEDNPLRTCELSWDEALELGEKIHAKRTVYIHLSEPDGISPEEFRELGEQLSRAAGRVIEFGYDGQKIGIGT